MNTENFLDDIYYAGNALPWEGKAHKITNATTSEEAIVEAGLDWKVKLVPIQVGNNVYNEYQAIQRNLDNKVYGVVKPGWKPLQNVDAFKFFDPIVSDGLAKYDYATEFLEGENVCMLTKLNSPSLEVVPGDKIDKYLLLSNGHNGKIGINIKFIPVRAASNTMLNIVEDEQTDSLRIIHSPKALRTLQQLRDVIENAEAICVGTVRIYQHFAGINFTQEEAENYIAKAIYKKRADVDSSSRTVGKIAQIYNEHPSSLIKGVQGTLWAAYNAVALYVDHLRGHDESRLHQSWHGNGKVVKEHAFDEALKIASEHDNMSNSKIRLAS